MITMENEPIAFLPFGLPPNLLAAYEREVARWKREDEAAARAAAGEPESNVIWGVDFVAKTWGKF